MRTRSYALVLLCLLVIVNGSLLVTHYYGNVTLHRWRYLLFIGTLTDSVAAVIAMAQSWGLRKNRFAMYYAMALGGIALEPLCSLFANVADPPTVTNYGILYACLFWSGRWTKTFGIWLLVLFQMRFLNGKKG